MISSSKSSDIKINRNLNASENDKSNIELMEESAKINLKKLKKLGLDLFDDDDSKPNMDSKMIEQIQNKMNTEEKGTEENIYVRDNEDEIKSYRIEPKKNINEGQIIKERIISFLDFKLENNNNNDNNNENNENKVSVPIDTVETANKKRERFKTPCLLRIIRTRAFAILFTGATFFCFGLMLVLFSLYSLLKK